MNADSSIYAFEIMWTSSSRLSSIRPMTPLYAPRLLLNSFEVR